MNTWAKAKLSDIYKFQYGKGNKNPSNGGKYPVYGAGSVIGYFDEYNAENSPVIGHMGANCGTVIFGRGKHFVTYNGIMALIKAGCDPMFGYYLLLSKDFKKSIRGSAQPFISYDLLDKVDILLPDLPTQEQIGSVLSAYDNLIENNEKRIKALEEMAQLLYTEWFVKFKFPGHEKVRMVDRGTEYGMIPEGWEVKKIKDLGKVITGKTPSTANAENFGDYMPFIKTPDIHGNIFVINTEQSLSEVGANSQSSKILPAKTVFISCIGTLGVIGITSKLSQTNQQINALVLNDSNEYCWFYCFSRGLKQKLIGLGSNGATMGNVNKDKFENIEIVHPEVKIRELFFESVGSLFDEILFLQLQTKKLGHMRDLLIPQLVIGKRILKK